MLTESEQIEAIYDAYPRKVGKRKAFKEIEKAIQRVAATVTETTVDLANGDRFNRTVTDPVAARRFLWKKAAEYAASPAGQKPQDPTQDFRPHPATWFHQDRFYDDPAEWQKPNGRKNGKTANVTAAEGIARVNAKVADLGRNPIQPR